MADAYDLEYEFDSLNPIEKKVRIGKVSYVLREANGEVVSKYQAARMRNIEIVDGKSRFLGSEMDVNVILVAGCLFEVCDVTDKNPSGLRTVPKDLIKTWPHRILEPLIEKTKEISGIDQDDLETLTKQRDKLEERIAKLRKDEEHPTSASSESTETGSV